MKNPSKERFAINLLLGKMCFCALACLPVFLTSMLYAANDYYLFPASDAIANYAPSTGDYDYACVSNGTQGNPANQQTTKYCYVTNNPMAWSYTVLGNTSWSYSGDPTINSVTVYAYVSCTGGCNTKVGLNKTAGNKNYLSSGDTTQGAHWSSYVFTTNPSTGAAWQASEISGFRYAIGCYMTGSSTWYFYDAYIDINYATPATLSSITVTPSSAQVYKGKTVQYHATGSYSDSSTQDITQQVTWSSNDTNTATISSSGLLTGAGEGRVTVMATMSGITGSETAQVLPGTEGNTTVTGGTTQYNVPGWISDWTGVYTTSYDTYKANSTVRLWAGTDNETDIVITRKDFITNAALFGVAYSGILGFALLKAIL